MNYVALVACIAAFAASLVLTYRAIVMERTTFVSTRRSDFNFTVAIICMIVSALALGSVLEKLLP